MECSSATCDVLSRDLDSDFKFITVKRSRLGYGFKVQRKVDTPSGGLINNNDNQNVYVVQAISEKNTKNRLRTGDEILSFNGTSVRHLKQSAIEETLSCGQDDITLIIRRPMPMDLFLLKNQQDDGYHSNDSLRNDMPREARVQPTSEVRHQQWNITL